jgi:hypothetical protein
MKDNIVSQIIAGLEKSGVQAKISDNTDLSINMEFLDAKWSTGEKKISYEASILINETDSTVYMYEKTAESGSGFGFGMNNDSTVQSGTTLFRKVKAVTYGPEGEVINIEIDLGLIPKVVKDIAKENGLKFKTVIFKKKALYPNGVKPIVVQSVPKGEMGEVKKEKKVEEVQKPIIQPMEKPVEQPVQKVVKEKAPKSLMIAVGALSVITVLFYLLVSVNIVGWVLGTGVIVGLYFLAKNIGKPVVTFALLIPAFIVLFFIMALTMDSSSNNDSNGNNNGFGSFGQKMDDSKNLVSFEVNVSNSWTKLEPTMDVYSKVDDNIYSSFNVMQTNEEMDDNFYKDYKNADYTKYFTGITGYKKTDKINIGNWEGLKLEFDQEDIDVTTYMYFINIPGKIDLFSTVATTSDDIERIAKECESYLAKIQLKYE